MTTMTFNHVGHSYFAPRAPRKSFAARLAALQASREHAAGVNEAAGVLVRSALAAIPFVALSWMFVAI